jgi:exocyst complex component 4
MLRYYERCFSWYKGLVTKAQERPTDPQTLRASAKIALEPGDIHENMKKLWTADSPDHELLEKEIGLLILQFNETRLEMSDIIQDRDTISSLCLLYTSMKWLAIKISSLRHITQYGVDSSRPHLPRQTSQRWNVMNETAKTSTERGSVYLPMTQETVQ